MTFKPLKIAGLMSGTSLDGVDAAILTTDGESIEAFGPAAFRPYSAPEREILASATRDALAWQFKGPKPGSFARAQEIIHTAHIEAVRMLGEDDIDLIGFHGQTVLHHAPQERRRGQTLQLGDGGALARELGVDTVYDFRSHDVAAGGQGAPLAPIYHKALLERAGLEQGAAVLNIGGVSNITLIGADGRLHASDCGPGNGPLDSWMARHGLGAYDKDGRLSLSGTPDFARIEGWLRRDFFTKPAPKSADRYDFDVLPAMHGLSAANGAATLCGFTALSAAHTVRKMSQTVDTLIVCGGGRHNPAMMLALADSLHCTVKSADDLGWDGDALEAQAFAFMAARSVRGLPLSYAGTTGAPKPMTGGVLAKPR